jgi:hypothetical protein
MIRSFTLICVMLFLVSGFYDYQITHKVAVIDQQISDLRTQAADTRNDSKMLQTEWSWLNRPDRLQPFAAQFLSLQQIAPTQYVPIEQLAQRLPAAGPPPVTALQLAENEAAATTKAIETKLAQTNPPAPAPAPPIQIAAAPAPAPKLVAAPLYAPTLVAALTTRKIQPAAAPSPSDKPARGSGPVHAAAPTALAAKSAGSSAGLSGAARALLAANQPVAVRPKPNTARVISHSDLAEAKLLAHHLPPAAPMSSAPMPSTPIMMAENQPSRAAAPRSLSALGEASNESRLPAPVAVSNVAWRSDQ